MTPKPFTMSLLADQLRLVEAVTDMRWREWGHAPEPEDPAWWLETTTREAGRDQLPVTLWPSTVPVRPSVPLGSPSTTWPSVVTVRPGLSA